MKKHLEIILELSNYFEKRTDVKFAYLFGSFGTQYQNKFSDLDIAIYTNRNLDLLSFGKIVIDLEKICSNKVDLIELNELNKKNPLLSYEIISKGKLIKNIEDNLLVNFKRQTFQNYFDTIKLRETVNTAFYNRLSENKFGDRNYA